MKLYNLRNKKKMPAIRYTLSIDGEEFQEMDTFEHTKNPQKLIEDIILAPMQDRRAKRNEPPVSLTRVEVLNPHVHQHTWERTYVSRANCKAYYRCIYCDVIGWKPYAVFKNCETSNLVIRDEAYKKEKYALCHDTLKPLPKKLAFR